MSAPRHDVLVIGGGPGGSAAATYLARAGRKVLLLEKEVFPRFHIGESLLPYNRPLWEEMGVMPALEAAGFPKKFGAQFYIGNGSKHTKFVFANGAFTREKQAIQVERATYDHILLKHARACGADVREGWTVQKFSEDSNGCQIDAIDPQGQTHRFAGSYLVDASGRGNLTGNQQGLREVHPNLKKLAVFGHFRNVRLDEGSSGGDTVIVRLENKWFWLIPISREKTSVGCVMDQAEFGSARLPAPELFERLWRASPVLSARMERAELAGPIQTTGDFSYQNRTYIGERLFRVGDAAGFMDPIFSAGVFLAMYSGRLAAQTILKVWDRPGARSAAMKRYENRLRDSMKFYWDMVHSFYTTPFLEVFFEPRERLMLASAVNAALAGELEGGWRMRARMRIFFLIVRAQARLGFLPRISFAPTGRMEPALSPT